MTKICLKKDIYEKLYFLAYRKDRKDIFFPKMFDSNFNNTDIEQFFTHYFGSEKYNNYWYQLNTDFFQNLRNSISNCMTNNQEINPQKIETCLKSNNLVSYSFLIISRNYNIIPEKLPLLYQYLLNYPNLNLNNLINIDIQKYTN